MDKKELFKFYEKLYFHEIEYRDKITSRLQLPLAIYITFLSLLGFMVRNINFACNKGYLISFLLLFTVSSILMTLGIVYFIKSFYGHTYEFIPTANATEAYRKTLNSTYEEYENGDELSKTYLEDYMYTYYQECSSKNAVVNDKRSENLHKANSFIVFAAVPLVLTFLFFHFGNIDKNMSEHVEVIEMKKPLEINFSKDPLEVEIVNGEKGQQSSNITTLNGGLKTMSEKEEEKVPPLPPPPPPKRLIREDVKIGDMINRDKKERSE